MLDGGKNSQMRLTLNLSKNTVLLMFVVEFCYVFFASFIQRCIALFYLNDSLSEKSSRYKTEYFFEAVAVARNRNQHCISAG